MEGHGTLSDFLRLHRDELIEHWSQRARTLASARTQPAPALVDHMPMIVMRIAEIVESGRRASYVLADAPKTHAVDRFERGFDLDEVVAEYALLRGIVLDLWRREVAGAIDVEEATRFDVAIDTAITEAAVGFAQERERALFERELEFQALADNIAQLAWMADAAGNFYWYNKRWFDYTGESPEAMKGWGWQKVHHPDHLQRVVERWRGHLERGEQWEDTFPLRGRDGRYRWFLSRAFPIRDREGKVVRWFGTNTDITDEREIEEGQRFLSEASALLASSLESETALEHVTRLAVPRLADWCIVDVVGKDGRVRRVAMSGDGGGGTANPGVESGHPKRLDSESVVASVMRSRAPILVPSVSEEETGAEDVRLARSLGAKSFLVAPMIARDRVLGALSFLSIEARRYTARDLEIATHLAHRVALALENARLYEESQRASRLRDDVLAMVSHDLRNPVGAVELAAVLLSKELLAADAAPKLLAIVHSIQRSTRTMSRLISDLLDVVSIQAGRLAIDSNEEAVGVLLEEAIEAHAPHAYEKGIALTSGGDSDERVAVDRERVLQVLGNLIGNAIKFSGSGDRITVRAERKDEDMLFSVEDTGPGIAEVELPQIFDAYWSSQRHARKGTGLGLYISRGIVEAHGGRIWAESKPGTGTRVSFSIPRTRAPTP